MEYYFKNFNPTVEILRKSNRAVILAQSNLYYENCNMPKDFIIKIFKSDFIPLEISLQVDLCQKSNIILKVYDYWKNDEYFYLAMEYCLRGDLHRYLIFLNGVTLDWPIVLQKCYEVCFTVNIIHSSGYAHRDIKPLNIYITENFEFKLADFGEAKYIGDDDGNTDFHTIRGTPYYMSPEVKNRHDKVELMKNNPFRDDIWGLALTFIEIAMGKLCPEVSKMNNDELWGFLAKNIQCFGNSEKFVKLIFCMMPADLQGKFYTANQVLRVIEGLINDLSQYNQPIIAPNIVNPIVEIEKNAVYESRTQKNLIPKVEEYKMPDIPTETFRVQKPLPVPDMIKKNDVETNNEILYKIDNQSDNNSISESDCESDSDSVSIDLEELMKQNKEKNTKIEEDPIDNSYCKKNNEKLSSDKFETGNIKQFTIEKPGINYSIKPNAVQTVLIERSGYVEPLQSVPGRNTSKIEDVRFLIESVQIPPALPQYASQSVILPSIPIDNCSKCNQKINEQYVKLDCSHFFHRDCFKTHYESKIEKAKRPSDIACMKCFKLINIESLSNMNFLEKKAFIRANVLNYSNAEVRCDKCGKILKKTMINPKKLKPEDAKCKDCQRKICSFCSVIGGHRFSCDLFNDYLKGKSDFKHYYRSPEQK
ncbi:hypothetical protein SteCoe_28958 [Stentor coeruleus]|uniref:Protein kinase domain-containing protein n=1 Tax=Stentor coeruleus TaxID=5963 RepID=A0A1R2B729_9CILI|nr:hypothetical protein SteCoe_28958 [Stentor coeruleus]